MPKAPAPRRRKAIARPNVLVLLAEDTGRHHGCYGDPVGHTPHLDQLAAQGARFAQCWSTAPVCAPARCGHISGRYAWSLGAHHMRSTLCQPPAPLYTQTLREEGYWVDWANKTDFNFEPPAGWRDTATRWWDALARGELPRAPWFLYHNLFVTHESTMWPENWAKHAEPHLPESERTDPATVPVPPYLPDTPVVRADLARYYDSLRVQDAEVGRILAALDRSGQTENTLVVYLADHGRGLVREKCWCYPAGLQVPLIVRWPGRICPGTVVEHVVSSLDLAPSLLAAVGLPVPTVWQGQPWLSTEGLTAPGRTFAFAGRDRMDEAFDHVRAVTDGTWLYLHNGFPELPYAQRNQYMEEQATTTEVRRLYAAGQLAATPARWMNPHKPAVELYHLPSDPHAVVNLADRPEHQATAARLRDALRAELDRTGDRARQTERALIAEGVVTDRMAEYAARIARLPSRVCPRPPRHRARATAGGTAAVSAASWCAARASLVALAPCRPGKVAPCCASNCHGLSRRTHRSARHPGDHRPLWRCRHHPGR